MVLAASSFVAMPLSPSAEATSSFSAIEVDQRMNFYLSSAYLKDAAKIDNSVVDTTAAVAVKVFAASTAVDNVSAKVK